MTSLYCNCYSYLRIVTVCTMLCPMLSCHLRLRPMTVVECREELTRSYLTPHPAAQRRGGAAQQPSVTVLVWSEGHGTSCTETGYEKKRTEKRAPGVSVIVLYESSGRNPSPHHLSIRPIIDISCCLLTYKARTLSGLYLLSN